VASRPAIDLSSIELLLGEIEAAFQPEQVWLFGSRARGDARPESDWDLFVVVPDASPDAMLNPLVAWRLAKKAGVCADVIPCRASDFRDSRDTVNTLAYTIARDGVLVRER
jgi:predicted nucleotidyltransferase